MICEEVRANLVARLDDELDVPLRAAVDAHLASCRACAGELAALRAVGREVGRHLSAPPGPGRNASFEALWSRVVAESGERPRHGLGFGRRAADGGGPTSDRGSRPAGAAGSLHRGAPGVLGARSRGVRTFIRMSAIGGSVAAAVVATVFAVSTLRSGFTTTRPGGASAPPASVAAVDPAGAPPVGAAPQARGAPAAKVASRAAEPPASAVHVASTKADDAGDTAGERDLHVPDEVRRHPGMFLDLPIVQRLEKLRNMEAVYRDAPSGEGSG